MIAVQRSGYGIIAAATPGMTRGNAFYRHFSTLPRTVFAYGFQAVGTASGRIAAFGAKQRGDSALVKANNADEQYGKQFTHGEV